MRRLAIFLLGITLHFSLFTAFSQRVITTVAGSEIIFPREVRALEAPLEEVSCAASDARGNLYRCDAGNHVVAQVGAAGTLAVVAGNGIRTGGFSGDGDPASGAGLHPFAVAVDAAGNLYIADRENRRIRKINPQGIISTVAGTGQGGFSGDGGPASGAGLHPFAVAVDAAGNLYLRALDAIHLAAALEARREAGRIPVVFCSFDARQAAAARAEGLSVAPCHPEDFKSIRTLENTR